MSYQLSTPANEHEAIQLLEDKIYEYNSARIQKNDGVLFSKIIKDEQSEIVAGVGGWTWAGICEITQLWVSEHVRKNGLGKKLLEAAETEAKSKGCAAILVRSYSFQAPGFYKRFGYEAVVSLKDFPKGHDYYFLIKKI